MSHHKEQTINLLESVHLDTYEVHGQAEAPRDLRLRLAEVHATLALVEQQRIANLLAFVASVQAGVYAGDKPNEVVMDRMTKAGVEAIELLGLQ